VFGLSVSFQSLRISTMAKAQQYRAWRNNISYILGLGPGNNGGCSDFLLVHAETVEMGSLVIAERFPDQL
jgi:hypothetical protein